jgi:TolB-like protein
MFMATLFLIAALPIGGQSMRALPKVIVKPFIDLSEKAPESMLGAAITTMLRSAIDRSLVFQTLTVDPSTPLAAPDLQKRFSPRERRSYFLLEGTLTVFGDVMDLDVRVSDLLDDSLQEAISIEVPSTKNLRENLDRLVSQLEDSLFRDTLGSMAISVKPASCNVYLDERFVGHTSGSGSLQIDQLQPGPYTLRLVSPGFSDYTDSVNIQGRRATSFSAILTPEPGSLVIDSDPPAADISLDGRNLAGKTPSRAYPISAGQHKIVVSKDGYIAWENTVSVSSNAEVGIKAVLERLKGSLRIASHPGGAQVMQAGKKLGTTPLQLQDLEPGEYVLEIALDDYASRTVSIQVESGVGATPAVVELSRLTGGLTMHSTPEGADASIEDGAGNRTPLGKTPIDTMELPIGSYGLRFEKEGYYPVTRAVTIAVGTTSVAEASLKFVPGSVRIVTDPRFAEVYLDDVFKGIAPLEISDLAPRSYTVRVKSAYGVEERNVDVGPGRVSEESFALSKPPLLFLSGVVLTGLSLLFSFSVMGQK